jgi:hypothetical protein
VGGEEVSAAELMSAVKDCCSKAPGFITRELPILESVFRLFLANGNSSLNLEQLFRQLNEWWGEGRHRTSVEVLSRLLNNDRYYGLSRVPD